MKSVFQKTMCTVLSVVMLLSCFVTVYAEPEEAYMKSVIADKSNHTITVSCKFPNGQENRIATVILAKEEIASEEAIDVTQGKIENIMMEPIAYRGDMKVTVGYDASVKDYILYVICGDVRLSRRINLSEHLASFNLSDEYGALESTDAKGRLAERLEELPEEVSVLSPVTVNNSYKIYVSDREGSDTNDGSENKPLKSIEAALEKLAKAEEAGTIILRGGTYQVASTVRINGTHTHGTTVDDVTMIQGYAGEDVYIESNPHLSAEDFEPIDTETAKSIIDESARNKVVKVNLPSNYDTSVPTKLKLYINGNAMMQSRWPNNSEVRMGTVTSDKEDGWTTKYLTRYKERLDQWDFASRNIYFNGCFNNAEYAPAVTLIRNYDTTTGEVTTGSSWSGNANPEGEDATHFYCNVLEEIDVPGEWCVDKNRVLYLYPTEDFEDAEIVLGTEGEDAVEQMIQVSDANRLVFDNIHFQYAKSAVFVSSSSDVIFQNCRFSNIADRAVVFEQCKYSGVIASELADIGETGIEFTYDDDGEDVFGATLTDKNFCDVVPSRNFVQNCVIHGVKGAADTGAVVDRWGIGNIFSHNVIGNVENNGFYFTSPMEHIVEYNEIYSFAQDISDSGGVYFGSLRSRGNMIRYNYIHDPLKGGVGVYFDNMSGGNYAYGNVIKNCLVGFSTNGGRDNAFAGNVIINDDEKFDKDVMAIYTNPWQYHPSGTTYWADTVVPQAERILASELYTSQTIMQRYGEWITQLSQIQEYLEEKEEQGASYQRGDVNDKTDKQNIARGLSGNYIGNNLVVGADNHMEELLEQTHVDTNGVNHGKYCWMWGIDGFCDQSGKTENVNTNVTYNDGTQAGFVDYANDDFTLNANAGVFQANAEFQAVPFEKMGAKVQQASMAEAEFYGVNHTEAEDGSDMCYISWSNISGAEEYRVTIATDAEFQNIVSEGNVRDTMYVYQGKVYARPYYIKIAYRTSSKLYRTKTQTAVCVFQPKMQGVELIDRQESESGIVLRLQNNTGEDIVANIFQAQYGNERLQSAKVQMNTEIKKDATTEISIVPQSGYSIKVFVWDNNQTPYSDAIIVK